MSSCQPVPQDPGAAAPHMLLRLSQALGAVAAVMVLALACLINADVLSRFLLNSPIRGVAELVELAIVIVVFVQLPLAVATGGLIRSAELHQRLSRQSPQIGTCATVLFELCGALVLAVLAIGLWPEMIEAWRDGLYKGQPGIFTAPLWPAMAATVIGSALGSLCYIASLFRRMTTGGRAWT